MDIGKLLALGAAGYIGYRYFLAPHTATVSTAAGGILPATTPIVPAANPLTTQSMVLAAASKDNFTKGTVDEWDWYYGIARGVAAPDPGDWGITEAMRPQILTFPEWWGTASAHGLSGRSGYVRGGL